MDGFFLDGLDDIALFMGHSLQVVIEERTKRGGG
jgi:hypothetical protein